MVSAFVDVAPKALALFGLAGLFWGAVVWDQRRVNRRITKRAFAGNRRPADRSVS